VNEQDELLTLDELAAYLKKPKGTIYGWRYRGEGPPATSVGRELRFRRSGVDAWLAAHTEPAPAK
jgi:excisionase family DNA binding protein